MQYLFRVKCERIDTSFFTVKNLKKTYEKFKVEHMRQMQRKSGNSEQSAKSESSSNWVKNHREYDFNREMFTSLLDIIDAITSQIFEKVSVIPYAIRQFCKCLYQMTMEKLGKDSPKEFKQEAIKLVAHYILDNWLLKACLKNMHLEGLTKEFYLGAYCKKNFELTMDIMSKIMTYQEWEVPTPQELKEVER